MCVLFFEQKRNAVKSWKAHIHIWYIHAYVGRGAQQRKERSLGTKFNCKTI